MDRRSGGPPSSNGSSFQNGNNKRPRDDDEDRFDGMDDVNLDDVEEEMGPPSEDAGEVELGEAGRNWERPKCPDIDPATQSIVFQQLDVDYYITKHTKGLDNDPPEKDVSVMRLFGVNETGQSVCAFVHGFEPYFYIEKPSMLEGTEDIDDLRKSLCAALSAKAKGAGPAVVRIEEEIKASVWGYQEGKKKPFLKIVMAAPYLVAPCKGMLEMGIRVGDRTMGGCLTYESNVRFALRFMIDKNVVGGNWVELPAGTYQLVPKDNKDNKGLTWCSIEAHIRHENLISHPAEGEWSKIAPLRVLSFDIECAGRKGHFPDASIDPVIQIASMVTVQGESKPIVKNVMTLGSCASIVGAEVFAFDSEAELLSRWMDLLLETDPDVMIGYNILNFDLPYLYERAEALKIQDKFHRMGRIRGCRTRMGNRQFSSKALGTHDYKDLNIEGRVQLDMMVIIQREHKLSSYSLNAVSAHFLGEQKEDVHHSCISDLQNGNEETRRRLAVYCLKDAYLPQRLLDKLMCMYNQIEMARVTGVPMTYLLTMGQSIKVYSQLLRKARTHDFLLPNMKVNGNPNDGVAYEGATVLDPKMGYYDKPVATLDFASLYPSIMMAHNLCYTSLVSPERAKMMAPEDVAQSPCGDWFVKAHKHKGILPIILEELLGARKRARADLKAEPDPFKRAVLDGRQLALKVSANSVYGFTGATVGKMPCLQISSSTTAYGRQMIMFTREEVMKKFTRANGYEADCDVIYGDTDSVMVNFKVADVARAMELGREAAAFVSEKFIRPVKLEFEKVYFPYLLMNKKRYAGLLWTSPEKHDKMDSKGIETVRRDNCLLVKNMVTTCLERILIKRDVEGAVAYVKDLIRDLLMNKVDLSLLVVSKSLSKDVDAYDAASGHVELTKKMRKRDPATAPVVGDRVAFVIIRAAKGAKAFEKAEDPIYALDHNLPIDCQHYLEHHVKQPLLRIFEPVLKNPQAELLQGDHMRSMALSTPSHAGGIMKFTKVKLSCLGCRAPLSKPGETSLCVHCMPQEAAIYHRSMMNVAELESTYSALWTQCQRCQGALHQDVLCTSKDCPIFYRRKKVQKDLNEAQNTLARFVDEW
uniref:DNA polymerase n=1 Tax=Dunaliella tertiolecta TaxID=3047 RepID=A0A7S3QWA8_DUNTE|mmetsp:Transcript_6082/g.16187  ORF Transcript_6082/g.16187 Transcript_6082/m.16187 type:complete len:1095 (-) Transcript_6082:347-3631(-)